MGSGADMERELEERMRSRSMAAWVMAVAHIDAKLAGTSRSASSPSNHSGHGRDRVRRLSRAETPVHGLPVIRLFDVAWNVIADEFEIITARQVSSSSLVVMPCRGVTPSARYRAAFGTITNERGGKPFTTELTDGHCRSIERTICTRLDAIAISPESKGEPWMRCADDDRCCIQSSRFSALIRGGRMRTTCLYARLPS